MDLDLTWRPTGEVLSFTEGTRTCSYQYGQATGTVLLGDVDLLLTGGGTSMASDPTETNVGRCVTS